jgi:hypothetical protein
VDHRQIPWEELAFPSTSFALESWIKDRQTGTSGPHQTSLTRRYPG